jgi:hypothetical protein
MVQIGFTMPNTGSRYTLEQTFPVAMQQVTVALEKVGSVSMTSAQFSSTGDVRAESGTPFVLGNGPALAANATLRVDLTGLPAESRVPRYVALGLAGAIIAFGAFLAFGNRGEQRQTRQRLIARRDTLLGELAQLEERRRAGGESLRQSTRRNRILAELEQIYGELDETSAGPGGGGEGVAA